MTTFISEAFPHTPRTVMALYHRARNNMLHRAANADKDTVRATIAYVALWLLASLSAIAYITHLSALFQ